MMTKIKSNWLIIIGLALFMNSAFSPLSANTVDEYDYEADCKCYSSNLYINYRAIGFYVNEDPVRTRYYFEFEQMGGDLDIYQYEVNIETGDWYQDGWGLYTTSPFNEIKDINIKVWVLKNDVEPSAYRNFRLKYKKREIGELTWDSWLYSDEFTVSISDIEVSGPTGTLCTSNQTYSVSPPTGYTTSWSFSSSLYVTPSSGTTSSATLKGNCYGPEEGDLVFEMVKSGCPTFYASRSITVNGPDASDVELDVQYASGGSAPKTGSTYLLCEDTYYYIYLDNNSSCATSNYSWTLPSGWTKNYQSSNMVSIYTNSSPGGMLTVKGQTCCSGCGSNLTLHIGYFGEYWNCGGYFMMMPNPSTTYIDLDADPQKTTSLELVTENEISITILDKMGVQVFSDNVTSLPYRINTSKLNKGEYIARILRRSKVGSSKNQNIESIKFIVSD